MAAEGYNSADLTSVLRTLSALSNSQNNPQISASVHQNPYPASHPAAEYEDEDPYEPAEATPSLPVAQAPSARPQHISHGPAPTTHASTHPSSTAADSSKITTWPAALRHVMRAVSQNEESQRRIRRLIQSQHDHERQWWQGREALLTKQKARIEKKKELDAVLRSVGAPVDDTKQVSTVEEDQAELRTYDAKVYKASRQMAEAMTFELRALRIPFFTLQGSLISDASTHPKSDASAPHSQHASGGTKDGLLTKEEVAALQHRMLDLLQDLCKE